MQTSITKNAAVAALIAVIFFSIGFGMGGAGTKASIISRLPLFGDQLDPTPPDAEVADLWKAWNALSQKFVESQASSTAPTDIEKVRGAIAGLAASYKDPYTLYFPPVEAKKFQESIAGNFGGIGIEIDVKDGVLTVISPLKGTPAELAGIKAGDTIAAIDGKPSDGLSVDEAVSKIRGPKGTRVVLTLMRGGKSLEVPVVRDTIIVPEIDEGLDESGKVYHIRLFQFTATSGELFRQAFDNFKASSAKKLIVDLRGNPGGYLEAAVEIASHFLPVGTTVVTEDHGGKAENETHQSAGYNDLPDGTKVVVLIDGGSASASEIFAGALKDNGIATIIGTRSFGKGSVQQLVELAGGSLKITVASWLTPSGTSISDGGLTPDIIVELTEDDIKNKNDRQMKRAIDYLITGK